MSFVDTEDFQEYAQRVYSYFVDYNVETPTRVFYSQSQTNDVEFVFHCSVTVGGVPVIAKYESAGGFSPQFDGWDLAYLLKMELVQQIWVKCVAGETLLSMEPAEQDVDYVPSLEYPLLTEITRELVGVDYEYTHTPVN